MITQRAQTTVEIEAVEGTAETLVAADAILAFNHKFEPSIEMHKRYPKKASLSPVLSLPGVRSGKMSFEVEMTGGAAGAAIHFSDLIKACGVGETLVASTSATYKPISTAIPAVTIGRHMDGIRQRIWGARGSAKLVLEIGKPGIFTFEMQGADFDRADEALLTGLSLSTTVPPVFQGATLTIDSYQAILSKVEIDFGNKLAARPDARSSGGTKSVLITGREPTISFDPEDVLVATKDFFATWRAGTLVAFSAAIGSTAGNIHTITAPKVQYQEISQTERDGIAALEIKALLCENTGDDEWVWAIT